LAVNIPLRIKLSIFYALIVTVSLLGFGAYTYFSVSNDLHSNLDASLLRVASSLEYIIKNKPETNFARTLSRNSDDKFAIFRESEKMRFVGPLRPSLVNEGKGYEPDIVWSAVYEHILLNPKNYYIQISDTNQAIIWRSRNLNNDSLPKTDDIEAFTRKDTISLKDKDSIIKLKYDRLNNTKFDSAFADIYIQGESVRLLLKKTDNAIISIAYLKSDIQTTLYQLFIIQLIALPFILVISIISGLFLSKLSLKTIEDITRRADVITASNLKDRLPDVITNDEVGHLTRTLNLMFERLESSFIQIKKFTSDASHELRTPLTILRGELELALHKQKTPAEYEAVLISALEEVARLTNVAETLLELSRAESGQIQMNLIFGNFSKLVADITEDAEILAEMKDVKVYSNIEPDVSLPFDGARMHQAVLNIVDNAIKYTPSGGSVYIELSKTSKTADVIIRDTGIGIPDEDLPHIFDRLYRVDKARSSSISGAGLGLSIVKWIIKGHNGVIDVNSINNKGTTFKISLNL
jgi:signal transduction histidine kinase